MGQKIHRNRSILSRFRDKHVFMFNTEIQEGCQKWRENVFCEMSPMDSTDCQKFHRNRSILLCFRHKQVYSFNTEIQDDREKWQENDFLENR